MDKRLRWRTVPFLALVVLLTGIFPAGAWPAPPTGAVAASRSPESGGQGVDTVWQIETVDSAGTVGWDTSIALDAGGRPHGSYCGQDHGRGQQTGRTVGLAIWPGRCGGVQYGHWAETRRRRCVSRSWSCWRVSVPPYWEPCRRAAGMSS